MQQSDVNLKKFIEKSIKEFPNQFWEAFSSRMIVDIFKIYQRNKKAKIINSVNFLNYENKEYSAVVVTSKNRPGILKDIVSGFTHSQSNILSSRIISLNNNQVIDVFWVTNFLNKGVLSLVMSLAFVGTMFANGPFEYSTLNCYDDISIDTEKNIDFLLFSMPSL